MLIINSFFYIISSSKSLYSVLVSLDSSSDDEFFLRFFFLDADFLLELFVLLLEYFGFDLGVFVFESWPELPAGYF